MSIKAILILPKMRPISVFAILEFFSPCNYIFKSTQNSITMKINFYLPALLALCLYSNTVLAGKPVITFSGDSIGCGSATLTAMGATTYVWSGGSERDSATNTFTSSGTYTVTGTNSSGTGTASINVTVKSKPTASINGPGTGCGSVT